MAAFPPRLTVSAVLLALVISACSGVTTQAPAAAAPGPDDASYRVHLRASGDATEWRGRWSVAFTNTTDQQLSRVWLRSWANGVQGCRPRAVRVRALDGGTLAQQRRERCSAAAVILDEPLAPGARARIDLALEIRVPERNDRFGTHRGLTLLGGALPILAVHDEAGWHLDPYVDLGESFYSLTSDYRVRLDVPQGLETATAGVLTDERATDRRVTRTYLAHDVREFSFAAGAFRSLTGAAGPTEVIVWFHPDATTARTARRVLADARTSMLAFSEAFGQYPYPEVDVVTSTFATFGGMEYPQIVFSNPDRLTVSHELAHQWWWGIVGDDAFAEPWLDESVATWSQYLPFSPWRSCSRYDWPSPTARITNDMAYWRDNPFEYGTIYTGGGCMLAALAREIGVANLTDALEAHAAANWLDVGTGDGFRATLEAAAAHAAPDLDMDAFWAEWRAN